MTARVLRLVAFCCALFVAAPALANDRAEAQAIVDGATTTVRHFYSDPDLTWFRNNAHKAKALLVVPKLVKGGFFLGGSGGSGVLLAKNEAVAGGWSYPAFYTLGSVTFGLQLGGEVSEVILIVLTQKGLDALLSRSFKVGGDVSVAAGPVGTGAKAQSADIIAFSRSKGLYGGVNVEGALVETRDDWNAAYYGRAVRPLDVLINGKAANAAADPLREELSRRQ